MAGRVRGRDGSNNLVPVSVLDFWLSGKIRTRTHTRSTRVLPVKIGTNSGEYPQVRVFLPCLLESYVGILLIYASIKPLVRFCLVLATLCVSMIPYFLNYKIRCDKVHKFNQHYSFKYQMFIAKVLYHGK